MTDKFSVHLSLSTSRKLVFLAAAPNLLTLLVGALGLYSLWKFDQDATVLRTDSVPGLAYISEAEAALTVNRSQFEAVMRRYEGTIVEPEDRVNYNRLTDLTQRYYSASDPAARDSALKGVQDQLSVIGTWNRNSCNSALASMESTISTARGFILAGLGGALLLGFLVSSYLVRWLRNQLTRSVNQVLASADEVGNAAAQSAEASHSVADGASLQAAAIEELSATGREVNALAGNSLKSADLAMAVVENKRREYLKVLERIEHLKKAMHNIQDQSREISKILKAIDEIAFQTNILALNAAVEAARAGEAGLGFAVVADAVRALAQRCAQASAETSAMVEASMRNSVEGTQRANDVDSDVQSLYRQTDGLIAQLHSMQDASKKQGLGLQNLTGSISQLERQTQRAAASAEEGAAASAELSAQAQSLREGTLQLAELTR